MFELMVGVILIIVGIIIFLALKYKKIRFVGIAPVLVGIVCIVISCVTAVPTGYTGILKTFGKVAPYTLDAGIHVKAPWQEVVKMDNRVQKESANLACFSSDIQEVEMVYTVNFQIRQADAMTIYSTIGVDYYSTVIVPCITESVKTITAKYTAENLIGDRTNLAEAIEADLSKKLDAYNVILVSTSIENMDFTDEFTNAVEAKQVAQQNKLKAETEAEQKRVEAKANADAKVLEAQGEAEALKIQAEAEAAANDAISRSLTQEVLERMYYETWDGKLPSVVGSDSVVVMPNQYQAETQASTQAN